MGFLTYFYNRNKNAKASKLTEDEVLHNQIIRAGYMN